MPKKIIITLALFIGCFNIYAFPVIIDINSHPYNAAPNDNKCDVEAIRRAIDDAKDNGIILFDPGEYLFDENAIEKVGPNKNSFIYITNKKSLTFKGKDSINHSVIKVRGSGIYFHTNRVEDLKFTNLRLVYESLPNMEGVVLKKAMNDSGRYMDVALSERTKPNVTPSNIQTIRILERFQGKVFFSNVPLSITATDYHRGLPIQRIDDNIRVYLPDTPKVERYVNGDYNDLTEGALVQLSRYRGTHGFYIHHSKNLVFENVIINSAGGCAVNAQVGQNLSFINSKIEKEHGIATTSTADGLHIGYFNGNINIHNGLIEGTGDDCIAIYAGFMTITDVVEKRKHNEARLKIKELRRSVITPSPGSIFIVRDQNTGKEIGKGVFRQVKEVTNNEYLVDVKMSSTKRIEVGSIVDDMGRVPQKVNISNMTLRESRARGVLLRANNTIIENCEFNKLTGPAIKCSGSLWRYKSSTVPQDITIKNNLIIDCCYRTNEIAAILVSNHWADEEWEEGVSALINNVEIRNNTIIGTPNYGIYIGAAKDVRILNNMISRTNQTPTGKDFENGSIVIDKSEKVTIDYNSWLGAGKGTIKIIPEVKNLTTRENVNFETITD